MSGSGNMIRPRDLKDEDVWDRMSLLYLVVSVAIIALGVIHIAATPRRFPHLTGAALWFASGGLAIMMTGALNLLRRAYGEMARGVRLVCVMSNVVMTGFALLTGYASRASVGQFVVVLSLLGGATVLSLLPAAQKHVKHQGGRTVKQSAN